MSKAVRTSFRYSPMQIGIDLGGTKIEGDRAGREHPRRRPAPRRDAARRLRRNPRHDRAPRRRDRGRGGAHRVRRRGHSGRRQPRHRLGQERQLHLAHRPAAAGRPRGPALPAGAHRQRRQLLHAVRGDRRRRPGLRDGLRRDTRHRSGRGHRDPAADPRGTQPDRRRMGPQSAAVDDGRGARGRAECYCGKFGCVETFLSGPGFERDDALRSGTRLEPGHRSSRGVRRRRRPPDAGAVPRSAGPRARRRPQPARPRRGRAGWRHVQPAGPAVDGIRRVAAIRLLRHGADQGRP